MAITGPLIVMTGLAILSIIISQLHKIVAILDKKPKPTEEPVVEKQTTEPTVEKKDEIAVPKVLPDDILETADIYQELIDKLEQPFKLSDLYKVADENNFPHPILTVSRLRDEGILVDEGDGLFIWSR